MATLRQLTLKKLRRRIRPIPLTKQQTVRRAFSEFASRTGLVRFRQVAGQYDDSSRLIRGISASHTHKDNYYCVGSFRSYDVAVVMRSDDMRTRDGRDIEMSWAVYQVDLRYGKNLPRTIIAHQTMRAVVAAKFLQLFALVFPYQGSAMQSFRRQYEVLTNPSDYQVVMQLLDHQVLEFIGSHCAPATIEIEDDVLRLLCPIKLPSRSQLEKSLHDTLMIAETIDEHAARIAMQYQNSSQ